MDPIKQNDALRDLDSRQRNLGDNIEQAAKKRRRVLRSALNYAGTAVGCFIIFVAIVVSTTDITIMTVWDWASLGLSFFVFIFCSYAMYINGSGSGINAGRRSDTYNAAKQTYDDLKKEIIDKKLQGRMPEFCRFYIEDELRNTRNSLLIEVGIDFAVYQERYVGKDKATLEQNEFLSKMQIEAIVAANKVNPIRLTPEMIMKRGRGQSSRKPLGQEPDKKRRIGYVIKFIFICGVSILIAVLSLAPKADLTWATFVECVLKLFPVVLNGFLGYKSGYENIVIDTVNYMNDQVDLMRQLIHYVEANPVAKPLTTAEEVIDERELAVQYSLADENYYDQLQALKEVK